MIGEPLVKRPYKELQALALEGHTFLGELNHLCDQLDGDDFQPDVEKETSSL